ncbi:LysM peptidoglycan-binding domain-containing protein [Cellulomonas hominis]|uniref:LysM peptidoglycan-binding domain-containing protein n=1 Tax=Cellulomonas hominis TaxID=156981 RepID=UPI0020BE68C8|nr:LysM peptidoglycan-binding domain-containing protein [Cellulomonas hominis]
MSAIAVQPRFVPGAGVRRVPGAASQRRASVSARAAGTAQVSGAAQASAAAQPQPLRPLGARSGGARPADARPGTARRDAAAGGAAVGEGRLHLTRRGRAVLVLLALLVVVAGVMGGRAVADAPQQATEVTTHAVQSGETLWEIAADVAAPGEDVRDVVLRLQELNALADGSLQAGQVLLLPAGA